MTPPCSVKPTDFSFTKLVESIVEFLPGEKWGVTFNHATSATFSREDGASFSLHLKTYPFEHMSVHGLFPRGPGGYDCGPRSEERAVIRFNPYKAPQIIAKDLSRRFLPTYLKQYAEAVELQSRRCREDEKSLTVARNLAGILGVEVTQPSGQGAECSLHFYGEGSVYGSFTVIHGTVAVKLSNLTADQAEKIAHVLAEKIAHVLKEIK